MTQADEFLAEAIQIAHLVNFHIDRITREYGSREAWLSTIGHSMEDAMPSYDELLSLLDADDIDRLFSDERTDRCGRFLRWVDFQDSSFYARWHAAALKLAYNDPSLW